MDEYYSTRVCESCSALDLESKLLEANCHFQPWWQADDPVAFRRRRQADDSSVYDSGFFICSFGTRLSLPTTCPLCSLLSSMRIQLGTTGRHKLLALCCTSMHIFNGTWLRSSNVWKEFDYDTFLAVLPEVDGMLPHEYDQASLFQEARHVGLIHRVRPLKAGEEASKLILRSQALPETVEFPRVSQWLSYCSDHHGNRCGAPKGSDTVLKEFRVIDCATNPASLQIRPFTVRYAALSYVWGHGAPEAWPAVVLDAVEVTRKLGLQYLWVDRLCIDQSNRAEKDYLISKMAWIYGCAEFTIVAAAGTDATYGLPGIRSARRKPQPRIRLSPELTLVSSMRDPRVAIEESVWSTRGWTYQEGVLSSRRVVFTDEQVYFECHGMALWESIELPLDLYHSESRSMMDSHMRSGIFRGSSDPVSSSISSVWGFGASLGRPSPIYQRNLRMDDHIYSFSRRVLSHDEDSLLAFSGVIDRLASSGGLRTILGLPVWAGGRRPDAALLVSFGWSLSSWIHKRGVGALGYDEFWCGRRRRHLPSWTWAGWEGTVTWSSGADLHSRVVDRLIEALEASELENGPAYAPAMTLHDSCGRSLMSLSEVSSLDGLANNRPYRLLIREPLILDVSSTAFDPTNISFLMSVETTREDVLKAHMTGNMRSVLTFYGRFEYIMTAARFVVLEKAPSCPGVTEQHWERVGMLDMPLARDDESGWERTSEAMQKMPLKRWVDLVTVV